MSKIQIEVNENDVVPGFNPSNVTYKFLDTKDGYRLLPGKFYGISWLKVGYHCPNCNGWHSETADHKTFTGQVRTLRTKATDAELKFIAAHKNVRLLDENERKQLATYPRHKEFLDDHNKYFGDKTGDSYHWGSDAPSFLYAFNDVSAVFYTTLTPDELQAMCGRWDKILKPKNWHKMSPIEVIACYNARKRAEAEKKTSDFFGFNKAEFTFQKPENQIRADFSASAEDYYTTLTPEELLRKLGYRYAI